MSVIVKIRVDDQGNARIVKLGDNVDRLKKKTSDLDKMMKTAFTAGGVLYGLNLMKDALSKSVEEVTKFQYAMKKIEGIGGITGKALESINKQARGLALETEFSASKIAEAMLELTKAGLQDPKLLNEATPNILDLATAATMELNYAAENTLATTRAFGLGLDETARVANVMATALNKTAMGAEDYMEAMKYVAPVAKSVNVSLEETSSLLGAVSNAGIKGSLAGTTLKNIFLNLLKPSKEVSAALQTMNLKGKSLVDILKGLKDKGMTVLQFLETFDKRAITGAEFLGTKEAQEFVNSLNLDLVGQVVKVKDVADVIRTALIPQYQIMINTANEVAISMFEAFGDRPVDLLQGITESLRNFDKWVDNNHSTIQKTADSVIKFLSFIADVGVSGMRALVSGADDLAIALAAAFAVGQLSNFGTGLSKINKGFFDIEKSAKKLSVSSLTNSIQLAIIAGTSLKILIEEIAQRWSDTIDKQAEYAKVTVKNTEREVEHLAKILEAYEKYNSKNAELIAARNSGASSFKIAELMGEVSSEYLTVQKVINDFTLGNEKFNEMLNTYEKANKRFLMMSKQVEVVKANDAKKVKKLPVKKANPTEDPPWTDPVAEPFEMWGKDDWIKKYLEKYYAGIEKKKKKLAELDKKIAEQESRVAKAWAKVEEIKAEIEAKEKEWARDALGDLAMEAVNFIDSIEDAKLERSLSRLETEKEAIQSRYDLEIAAAGENSFKKSMLEQESMQKQIAMQKKIDKEKEASAKREKFLDFIRASSNVIVAITDVMAKTPTGPFGKLAAAATIGTAGLGFVSQLAALNLRSGTKGVFNGDGNITSDSIWARVSKGERLLSGGEIDSLGGNEAIQKAIDRNTPVGSVEHHWHIGTIVGTKTWVRKELIPTIREEFTR